MSSEQRGRHSLALALAAVPVDLRGIHADEPHLLVPAAETHMDRVAVNRGGHHGRDRSVRRRLPMSAPTREEGGGLAPWPKPGCRPPPAASGTRHHQDEQGLPSGRARGPFHGSTLPGSHRHASRGVRFTRPAGPPTVVARPPLGPVPDSGQDGGRAFVPVSAASPVASLATGRITKAMHRSATCRRPARVITRGPAMAKPLLGRRHVAGARLH